MPKKWNNCYEKYVQHIIRTYVVYNYCSISYMLFIYAQQSMTFSSYLSKSFLSCVLLYYRFSWCSVTLLFCNFFPPLLQSHLPFICTTSLLLTFLPLHSSSLWSPATLTLLYFVSSSYRSFLSLPSYRPFTALFPISFYPIYSISYYTLLTTLLSILFDPYRVPMPCC